MAIKGSVRAPYVIEVHVPETINVNVNIPGLQGFLCVSSVFQRQRYKKELRKISERRL